MAPAYQKLVAVRVPGAPAAPAINPEGPMYLGTGIGVIFLVSIMASVLV